MERHYADLDRTGDHHTWIDQDMYLKVHTKLEDVEDWTFENPETSETYDPVSFDEWDSKPDGPTDSISVLDCDRWVVEVGCWRELCTWGREERNNQETVAGRRVGHRSKRR